MSLVPFFHRVSSLAVPLALAACNGSTAVPTGPTQANPLDADPERVALVQALTTLRATAGVSAVAVCDSLNVSASAHSDEMRDDDYLAEVSPVTGSDVRSRACAAGYTAACGTTIAMAELVAEGFSSGAQTMAQWDADGTSQPILVKAGMVVVGVGRSIGADNVTWTLDFSSATDPSCN
jgi:uncharacterized protein YkwD